LYIIVTTVKRPDELINMRHNMRHILYRKEASKFIDSLEPIERVEVKDEVEITISDEALEIVKKRAAWVHEKFSVAVERLETGIIGQAADAYEVKNNWMEGVEQMTQEPDKFDMLYRGFTIDDKTFDMRRYSSDWVPRAWMAVKKIKFHDPNRQYPLYIGNLRLTDHKIRIIGFATRRFLEKLESEGSIDNFSDPYEPNDAVIAVKNKDDMIPIKHLNSLIGWMLDSALKFNFDKV
jgi:hypothetical protein